MSMVWPHAEYRASEARSAVVKVSRLNVRGGPGVSYPVVGSLKLGDPVSVHGQMEYEGYLWGNISAPGAFDRWVAVDYLTWEIDGELPVATEDAKWERSWPIVLRIEGELSLDPNDKGNWYQGKLIGTKYGISAAVWGGQYDIPNLTKEQALAIYKEHYYDAVHAGDYPWPMCLAVFDHAVNARVDNAIKLLALSDGSFMRFMAERIDWYSRIQTFDRYGRAWMRRCADIMKEATK